MGGDLGIFLPRMRTSKHVWFQLEGRWGTGARYNLLELMTKNSLLAQSWWKANAQISSSRPLPTSGKRPRKDKELWKKKGKQENELLIRRLALTITPSTFLRLLTLKTPVQKIPAFSGWFLPLGFPSLPEYVQRSGCPAACGASHLLAASGQGRRQKGWCYSDFMPQNNFTHTKTNGATVKAR